MVGGEHAAEAAAAVERLQDQALRLRAPCRRAAAWSSCRRCRPWPSCRGGRARASRVMKPMTAVALVALDGGEQARRLLVDHRRQRQAAGGDAVGRGQQRVVGRGAGQQVRQLVATSYGVSAKVPPDCVPSSLRYRKYGDCSIAEITACAPSENERAGHEQLACKRRRARPTRPAWCGTRAGRSAWMNWCAQVASRRRAAARTLQLVRRRRPGRDRLGVVLKLRGVQPLHQQRVGVDREAEVGRVAEHRRDRRGARGVAEDAGCWP